MHAYFLNYKFKKKKEASTLVGTPALEERLESQGSRFHPGCTALTGPWGSDIPMRPPPREADSMALGGVF